MHCNLHSFHHSLSPAKPALINYCKHFKTANFKSKSKLQPNYILNYISSPRPSSLQQLINAASVTNFNAEALAADVHVWANTSAITCSATECAN
jgi:hypothetical protein